MKTAFVIIAFLFPSISFSQGNWKTLLKIKDTSLVCEFRIFNEDGTGSLDASIDTGEVRLPYYWLGFEKNHRYGSDIVFNTAKTFNKLFGKSYKSKKRLNVYLVRGKIIGVVPPDRGMPAEGYVFVVYQYKFLKRATFEEWPPITTNPE
ncbi:MAG TPA: hypothetical protein VHM26_02795 [Chitinophagaceae bacterium]|jgi:hypothetical protein|nr:hypothetical protein [Chitinophagaceae bacterium]